MECLDLDRDEWTTYVATGKVEEAVAVNGKEEEEEQEATVEQRQSPCAN